MKAQKECGRCCGKGFIPAFGHVAGGTCFNCMGRGFFVVNVAAEQRKQKAADARRAQAEARAELNKAAYAAVVSEMNAAFGPFKIDTLLGLDMLDCAVARATGINLAKHRDKRLAA